MSYDDIYSIIFQGLALNGFDVALSGTVDIDNRENAILLFLFAKLVYYLIYIEKSRLVNEFLQGFINPSFIHLLTDAWVVLIHLAK